MSEQKINDIVTWTDERLEQARSYVAPLHTSDPTLRPYEFTAIDRGARLLEALDDLEKEVHAKKKELVFELVDMGHSQRQIALALGVTPNTVNSWVKERGK